MAFVSSSSKMLKGKRIVVLFSCVCFIILASATKNDCDEKRERLKNVAYQYLNNTKPLRYQIYIDPCISDGNFSGYVHIDLLILEPTKNLTLHSRDLEFCEEGVYLTLKGSLNESYGDLKPVTNVEYDASSFQDSGELEDSSETVRPSGFVYYKKEETVTLVFKDFFKPGRYTLEINYMGVINFDSVGIYRKVYKDIAGENRVMLLTNFFPTSARRVFPCRDEPDVKAEIYFTMQTSLNFTTIMANTPDNYIDYKEGQRWSHYHPLINASTYQLNFAVLNGMKNLTKISDNKTYTTYATSSDLKSVKILQDTHEKAMGIMENFTKIKYPLDTFVNLVIPEETQVSSSASLGFISIKKSHALYKEQSGPQKKKDVVLRASRDVVNQWFNYIISPLSWKYSWLNEGLTEYIKYYVADKIMPHWRLQEIFAVWELQRRSFIPNKITDSPPLNKNMSDHPQDIQCLIRHSSSSTSMGASIIRMISHFLSEKIFHAGIVNFLKTNKYNSVSPNDFWESIQIAINDSKDDRLKSLNITEVMQTWTNAAFYPVLNVSRNYTTGLIEVTQIPAIKLFGLTEQNVSDKWWIPINYATKANPDFNKTFPTHWLKPDNLRLVIDGVAPDDWIVFNIQQTGYYRVLYDQENWKRLVAFLNSENYRKISPVNRAQIINDAVQFSLKRHLDMNVFIDLLSYLERETDYIPWYDAQFIFSFLNYHLSNTHAYSSLKKFCVRLIAPLVDKIGYEDRSDDDFPTLLLRRISNYWACHFGYKKCWKNATMQLEAYLDNKNSELGCTDLQEWAQCVGMYGANKTIWNKVFKTYQESLSETTLIYLACSQNTTILYNFLNMATVNDSIIPIKHVPSVFKSVCLYSSGDEKRINTCLNFINEKFDQIKTRFGNSTESYVHFLDLLASDIRQKSQLELFKKILAYGGAAFAAEKLGARIKQTENRISVFEQKADYYKPYLEEKAEKASQFP